MRPLAVREHARERPPNYFVVSCLERQPQVVHSLPELAYRKRLVGGSSRVDGEPFVPFQRGAYRFDFGVVQALICVSRQFPTYQYRQISQFAEDIKVNVVRRRNARGGLAAAEYLIGALR